MPPEISPYLQLPLRTLAEVLRARAERDSPPPDRALAGSRLAIIPNAP